MKVNAEELANHGAQLVLHWVIKGVVPDRIKPTCFGKK
jgi:hypothetical protein